MNRLENSWLALSRSLDSISHGHSAQIVLAQSLGSIFRGHSLALLTRRRTISRSRSDLSLLAELTCRSVVTRPTSPHSTDESSLDRRVLTRPTSPHSTDESSLDRRVVTRPTSRHSTDESSLDRFVVTRPFCRHSAQSVLSQSLDSICAVARLDLRSRLARSLAVTRSFSLLGADRSLAVVQIDLSQSLRPLSPRGVDVSIQQQGLAEVYLYLMYPSWLHDESSRKQLARALTVTRLDLSRSLGANRSRAVTSLDLSRSLARSLHLTDESSLDRFVVTRPTSRHSTDESSLDRRVLTRPFCRHSTVLSSFGAERSLAVARLDLRSRLA
ncbi:hypothetical protein F2Q68_00009026 [Brassica cretica]|uniref:Uncharacterized protein n=1 Tax=Brassica cretica TaxID=69181 RepID=A0A8S9KVY8_BRACR|nr:hypothetical protein F2Q68_00009026 [Brassica cretica]